LFPGKPKFYATTIGTTKEPKWIPVTEQYYREVYRKMNEGWFYIMSLNKPKVYYGPCVSIVGKAIEGTAPDGTVYGSISGVMHRDIPKPLKRVYTAPYEVFEIADYKARHYAIMRMGIERDTHLLLTANPATILELQNTTNEFFDDFCDDIEHGTISSKFPIQESIRAAMLKSIKPNQRRAEELRKLKERHGIVLPKHYWPNLQIVNTRFCGDQKSDFEKIKDSFPQECVFHEFSYVSVECKAGFVLKSGAEDTVVFGHKSYFEFIHEHELEHENPKVWQVDELEKGHRYCVLVTTCSGLYRYNMKDLIEVTGYYNKFPMIKFVQRINTRKW
jgi:hypothetical protein